MSLSHGKQEYNHYTLVYILICHFHTGKGNSTAMPQYIYIYLADLLIKSFIINRRPLLYFQVNRKDKQFLLYQWYRSWYSRCKPCDKSVVINFYNTFINHISYLTFHSFINAIYSDISDDCKYFDAGLCRIFRNNIISHCKKR